MRKDPLLCYFFEQPEQARVPIISDNFPIVQTNLGLLDMRFDREANPVCRQ